MHETPADITQLQTLLTTSIDRAGAFLKDSFQMPHKSMSAQQVIDYFDHMTTVALATSNAKGEPRSAPTAAVFYRGRFHVPTIAESARGRMITRNPAVSLTYYDSTDVAVIIHGTATILRQHHDSFAPLLAIHDAAYSTSLLEWGGEPIFLRIEPHVMWTYDTR